MDDNIKKTYEMLPTRALVRSVREHTDVLCHIAEERLGQSSAESDKYGFLIGWLAGMGTAGLLVVLVKVGMKIAGL